MIPGKRRQRGHKCGHTCQRSCTAATDQLATRRRGCRSKWRGWCTCAGAFINVKLARVAIPATVALAEYLPGVELAVRVGAVATPELSVETTILLEPPGNRADAPLLGRVKLTGTPKTATPAASRTLARSGLAKAVSTLVLWSSPEAATIECGADTEAGMVNFWICPRAVPVRAPVVSRRKKYWVEGLSPVSAAYTS